MHCNVISCFLESYFTFIINRLTPLDLALLNGHTSTAEYLISRGASTGGGKIHNSATLIQRSWKRYVRRVS